MELRIPFAGRISPDSTLPRMSFKTSLSILVLPVESVVTIKTFLFMCPIVFLQLLPRSESIEYYRLK